MLLPTECRRPLYRLFGTVACRAVAKRARRSRPWVEPMEPRYLLATTFTVSSLADAGANTLRQALTAANAAMGPSVIQFTVAGTITLTSGALPAITAPVTIEGNTAPGYAGMPVVEVNNNGFSGLQFNTGSAGSTLEGLAIDDASGAGVTLNDSKIVVVGNFIGLGLDGATPAPNGGDGLVINASSTGDTIGATSTLVPNISTDAISVASNVISSNLGNGITINGSTGDTLVANYIGTDVSGTLARGNSGHGIMLENSASGNTIGGTVVFNDSSGTAPDTNLISANGGDGILLTSGASNNAIASNFIGTNVTGNAPLGNALNGVALTAGANSNDIYGTTINQAPFVFANVISGNGANGILVDNANSNTIQADILGIGINNETPVGNLLDGIEIAGTSANTQFGGVIPLGNIAAANGANGVEIRDQASGTIIFNTFGGEAAFEPYTNLGNGGDGVLVTSTGGGNVIRTSVLSNNHGNGIEIAGNASGVQITDAIAGMNTSGMVVNPNYGDGILITGTAHDIAIGGFQPSVVPQNTISGNVGHGVAIVGQAYDNQIYNSDIGTEVGGGTAAPNGGAGVFIGGEAMDNTIGGIAPGDRNLISGNLGNGIQIAASSTGTVVINNFIGTGSSGTSAIPNGGQGISITGSSGNTIGGTGAGAGNVIAFNNAAGVFLTSGAGNAVLGNSLFANNSVGIVLQSGANNAQAAPRLIQVRRIRRRTILAGRLTSTASSAFTIQFFATPAARSTGGPQGETLLGTMTVHTNGRGVAAFTFAASTQPRATFFTATATSTSNNTSAFSNPARAGR